MLWIFYSLPVLGFLSRNLGLVVKYLDSFRKLDSGQVKKFEKGYEAWDRFRKCRVGWIGSGRSG
jgi:hypothetical protein